MLVGLAHYDSKAFILFSYCKYLGMKLGNWNAATCRSLAQVSSIVTNPWTN